MSQDARAGRAARRAAIVGIDGAWRARSKRAPTTCASSFSPHHRSRNDRDMNSGDQAQPTSRIPRQPRRQRGQARSDGGRRSFEGARLANARRLAWPLDSGRLWMPFTLTGASRAARARRRSSPASTAMNGRYSESNPPAHDLKVPHHPSQNDRDHGRRRPGAGIPVYTMSRDAVRLEVAAIGARFEGALQADGVRCAPLDFGRAGFAVHADPAQGERRGAVLRRPRCPRTLHLPRGRRL